MSRHRHLALGNFALRYQVAVYKRMVGRRRLRTADRLVWVGLTTVWAESRQSLEFIIPNTVLRWQRRRFRKHWAKLSGRRTVGRPPVTAEIIALLRVSPPTPGPISHSAKMRRKRGRSSRRSGKVMPIRESGRLHHRYVRRAA